MRGIVKIENINETPLTFWLEPECIDYTLLPGETFDVIAENASEEFHFHLTFSKDAVTIYPEGGSDIPEVFQNGKLLYPYHNREFSSFFKN
jgi:hypothetical protein